MASRQKNSSRNEIFMLKFHNLFNEFGRREVPLPPQHPVNILLNVGERLFNTIEGIEEKERDGFI